MSDPLHSALVELVERQRAELDELRPLLEEYQKRRADDEIVLETLNADWLVERRTVKANAEAYRLGWEHEAAEAKRYRDAFEKAYREIQELTEANAQLTEEVAKVRGWCRSIGLGERPRINGCELGAWLSFFEVTADEPPRT